MTLAVGTLARCKFRFEAENPAELGLAPNELVLVLEPDRDGWTYCQLESDSSARGCAPTNFLEAVSGGNSNNVNNSNSKSPTPAANEQQQKSRGMTPQPAGSVSTPVNGSGSGGAAGGAAAANTNTAVRTPVSSSAMRGAGIGSGSAAPAAPAYSAGSNNVAHMIRSASGAANGGGVPDANALMEGFHKNELYFQQLLTQRQDSTAALDAALREAATEIDLAKEKHASMTRRLKELDHMVTKERKRWKDRVEEERMLLAQRAGNAAPGQQSQQQQAAAVPQIGYGGNNNDRAALLYGRR